MAASSSNQKTIPNYRQAKQLPSSGIHVYNAFPIYPSMEMGSNKLYWSPPGTGAQPIAQPITAGAQLSPIVIMTNKPSSNELFHLNLKLNRNNFQQLAKSNKSPITKLSTTATTTTPTTTQSIGSGANISLSSTSGGFGASNSNYNNLNNFINNYNYQNADAYCHRHWLKGKMVLPSNVNDVLHYYCLNHWQNNGNKLMLPAAISSAISPTMSTMSTTTATSTTTLTSTTPINTNNWNAHKPPLTLTTSATNNQQQQVFNQQQANQFSNVPMSRFQPIFLPQQAATTNLHHFYTYGQGQQQTQQQQQHTQGQQFQWQQSNEQQSEWQQHQPPLYTTAAINPYVAIGSMPSSTFVAWPNSHQNMNTLYQKDDGLYGKSHYTSAINHSPIHHQHPFPVYNDILSYRYPPQSLLPLPQPLRWESSTSTIASSIPIPSPTIIFPLQTTLSSISKTEQQQQPQQQQQRYETHNFFTLEDAITKETPHYHQRIPPIDYQKHGKKQQNLDTYWNAQNQMSIDNQKINKSDQKTIDNQEKTKKQNTTDITADANTIENQVFNDPQEALLHARQRKANGKKLFTITAKTTLASQTTSTPKSKVRGFFDDNYDEDEEDNNDNKDDIFSSFFQDNGWLSTSNQREKSKLSTMSAPSKTSDTILTDHFEPNLTWSSNQKLQEDDKKLKEQRGVAKDSTILESTSANSHSLPVTTAIAIISTLSLNSIDVTSDGFNNFKRISNNGHKTASSKLPFMVKRLPSTSTIFKNHIQSQKSRERKKFNENEQTSISASAATRTNFSSSSSRSTNINNNKHLYKLNRQPLKYMKRGQQLKNMLSTSASSLLSITAPETTPTTTLPLSINIANTLPTSSTVRIFVTDASKAINTNPATTTTTIATTLRSITNLPAEKTRGTPKTPRSAMNIKDNTNPSKQLSSETNMINNSNSNSNKNQSRRNHRIHDENETSPGTLSSERRERHRGSNRSGNNTSRNSNKSRGKVTTTTIVTRTKTSDTLAASTPATPRSAATSTTSGSITTSVSVNLNKKNTERSGSTFGTTITGGAATNTTTTARSIMRIASGKSSQNTHKSRKTTSNYNNNRNNINSIQTWKTWPTTASIAITRSSEKSDPDVPPLPIEIYFKQSQNQNQSQNINQNSSNRKKSSESGSRRNNSRGGSAEETA